MTTLGRDTTITWLGHGTVHITTPGGKRLLIDPWLDTGGNPSCPRGTFERIAQEGLDAVFLTHGHGDHVGDAAALLQRTRATAVCIVELAAWLQIRQGVAQERIVAMNKGGTVDVAGIKATMTIAHHSSSAMGGEEPLPVGSEAGFVLRMENGFTIYIAGDTCVTYDMLIIGDLYAPELAILPIGDFYTMDPRQAAYAMKLLRAPYVLPCHYGTFPLLTGTPEKLREHLAEFGVQAEVIAPQPGELLS
jgi:L-ascorbate metabolism protein UlaG (beta-lactamase superfamily)